MCVFGDDGVGVVTGASVLAFALSLILILVNIFGRLSVNALGGVAVCVAGGFGISLGLNFGAGASARGGVCVCVIY